MMNSRRFVSFTDLKQGEIAVDIDSIEHLAVTDPVFHNAYCLESRKIESARYHIVVSGFNHIVSQEDYYRIKKMLMGE